MDMLINALMHYKMVNAREGNALMENAKISNMDVADFLYHHTDYDSADIADACALYFGCKTVILADLQEPYISEGILYGKINEVPITAIYKPSDIINTNTSEPFYFVSAEDYFNIRKTVSATESRQQADETTIEQLDRILLDGINQKASDIHFEPMDAVVRVRFRIHGLLTVYQSIHYPIMMRLITRLKVLSNADITQARLPQDGRFTFAYNDRHCDCRINFCPTIRGEKVVIRLLDAHQHLLQLGELGLLDDQKNLLIHHLHQAQGLILVTGPTGSGKTQTLYTAINYLNRLTTNISTIEDPVEIKLHGVNQINVDESISLTFSVALRSLLRQDPDVIMVGEIRDADTAALAIRAAQTGHLVLATLHTQEAVEAIPRLMNLGISRFDMAATLKLVIAQRLIRQFVNKELVGRTGIFELLTMTPTLQEQMVNNQSSLRLKNSAIAEGFKSLPVLGRLKIKQALTTIEELHRVGIDCDRDLA